MHRRSAMAVLAATLITTAGCSSALSGSGSLAAGTGNPSTSAGFPASTSAAAPTTSAPAATTSAALPGAVVSPDGDFSVVLPAGWRAGKASVAIVGYFAPAANGFQSNVNVNSEPVGNASLRQVQQAALSAVRSTLNVSRVSPVTARTIDGEPALEYSVFDHVLGNSLEQRQTIVLHSGLGYVITYTALRTGYNQSLDDANGILDSWRWS